MEKLNFIEIISIILIHWFADFVLQTDEQAKGKSKENKWLLAHTVSYSFVWFVFGVFLIPLGILPLEVLCFVGVTFVTHTITDYYTSRLNSKLWSEGKVHNFFVSVGFDQVLHYAQLFLTYLLLK